MKTSNLLWSVVLLFIVIDAGMTYWAITNGHANEANPNVVNWIEQFGLEAAIGISVIVRGTATALMMGIQRVCPYKRLRYLPLLLLLPVAAAPVVWNTFVLFA